MSFGAIVLLAVGLAMDATAVAAARGLAAPEIRVKHALRVAGLFGGFQAAMPLAGWLLGSQIGPAVQAWDHWIAFVLLGGLGAKMLWEARGGHEDDEPAGKTEQALFGWRVLLVLAVATSIDAFAVGITLPMLQAPLVRSVVAIGVITAVLSAAGLVIGRRFSSVLGQRLDALGGVVLIALGVKILLEHTIWA